MRKNMLALTVVVALGAVAAFAQTPTPVGSELFVGSYPGGYPRQIAADVDGAGNFVVAWYKSNLDSGVKVRQFTSTGVGGSELAVNTYAASSSAVDVSMADNGDFAVVWSGTDPAMSPATNVKVFGTTPVGPLALGYGSPSDAAISMNRSTGDFVVAWVDSSYGSVQKFDSGGNPVGSTYTFGFFPSNVDVAMDSTGNFVVAWDDSYGLYGSSFDSAGVQVDPQFTVSTSGYGFEPSVAPVGAGNFVVSWVDSAGCGLDEIKARIFTAAGTPVSGDLAVDEQPLGTLGHPSVTGNGTSFVVAWDSYGGAACKVLPSPQQDGSQTAVVGRLFDSGGTPLSGEFIVNTYTNGSQEAPGVGMNSSGQFVVGWANGGVYPNTVVAQPFVAAPPEITVSDVAVLEGNAGTVNAVFTVTLTPASAGAVTVDYATANGTATAGSDYTALPVTTLTFLAGETSKQVTVLVAGDVLAEPNETFTLNLTNPTNAIVTDAQGIGTITNDDSTTISISDAAVLEGNAGSTIAQFTVSLSSPSTLTVTVDYATADGSATAGSDYTALPLATLTFLPGDTSKTVMVSVSGDTTIETDESFFVNLSNPTNATIADPQGLGTITNDDAVACGTGAATNLSPSGGEVSSPVTFSWTGVDLASFYEVYVSVDGGPLTLLGLTRDTTLTKPVSAGAIEWQVVTEFGTGCRSSRSAVASVTVAGPPPPPPPDCAISEKPLPSVVAESTTGESYRLSWTAVAGASTYQVQESLNESFSGASTFSVTGLSIDFKHPGIETATPYHYRIRGVADCDSSEFGPYSKTIRVVTLPKPAPSSTNPQVVTEFGNQELVSTQLFIPGFGTSAKRGPLAASFTVSSNEPWLTPNPVEGELPPEGATVELVADPTNLELGANMATITVTRNDGLGRTTYGSSTSSVPVSVSLVAPVTPLGKVTGPPANTLFIPAVANVGGINSKWLSDVRISNAANTSIQYQLTFTATEQDGTVEGKKTGYTIRPGQTVAMDDIVRQWFGFGDLADGTNGTLEIRPLNFQGKSADPEAALAATVSTSRTYTRDANSLASYGQFMPSVPFSRFIGSTLPGARLSMQQVSQNQLARTNIGLVEGAGKPVDVLLTAFDRLGTQLGQFPVSLLAGEHRQLNQLLAQNNISVVDGRVEATVTGGDGSITAYASVVSSGTGDPTLVLGIDPGTISASKYVLAGVADLSNGGANWRSDVRIFNGSGVAQLADLYFYPQGSTTPVGPLAVTIAPNEVKVLESVVKTQFGLENTGGAMHIVTPNDSSLVVTGETFDTNDGGKYGQTIPSVTVAEAVGMGDRPLQLLQMEDSAQYRTNLGLAEMTGKPVTVQVQVIVPLSLSAPVMTVQLGANEFKQLNGVIRTLTKRDVYNARIAVKVTGGEGKILAYGSVVDNATLDATYVPGQ